MGQCCSAPRSTTASPAFPAVANGEPLPGQERGLIISAPVYTHPVTASPHSGSATSSITPGSERRRRAVAASPTRFFELLAEPSANKRKELLQKATTEYQAHSDLGPFAPDSPQSSVVSALRVDSPQNSIKKSRFSAIFSRAPPNEDAAILQDMCGEAWIPRGSLHNWRPLGSGAFAVVQQCVLKFDNGPGVQVAVKKLKAHVLNNTADLREFLSEANTLRRLKHRHIVEFKGVGCMEPHTPETMASTLFIVQEFMSGSTLKVHVLHQMFPSNSSEVKAAYSWKDALRWLQQIASALKYLHGLRPMVVHRDLKLENLLLTGSNPATADAKLADFGLCKLVKDSAVAVPFVPSTPNSNPQSQKAPSTSTPLGQAAPSSRPTDGQAVGSTPLPSASPAQHADDSAHASPQGVDADGSVVSTTDAAIAMDGQLSRSQDADAAAAAVTSQASRQTDSQTDSCVTSHMGPSLPTQAEPHVHIGPDAVMQQTGQPTASTSTAALESHSHGTPSTPDAQAGAVISSEAHAADAALGQRMIDSALSISAKEIALTPQLGSPTAPGVSMESQDVSTTGQGLSPAAQVLGTSVQGVSPSAQGVSASAEGVKVAAAASNTDAKDAAGSSEKQAAGSVQGSQMSMTATTLTSSDETDTADRQTNAAVRTAPTAASDGSKADEAQAQGPGLIPAFLGTAAQTGQGQGRAVVAGAGEDGEVLYNMTGQTGSLMYMAPEVMKGQSYNEKVDVFSFAVIIFELLSYRVAMAAIGDNRDLDYEAVHAHAQEVSHGFRLPLPDRWPPALQGLIRDCWAQKSSQRPSFAVIEQRLQDIQASGIVDEYIATQPIKNLKDGNAGTSCVVQ